MAARRIIASVETLERRVFLSAATAHPLGGGPIVIGQEVSGAIDAPEETDEYTFSAAAGQRVFFDVREATGVFATLLLDFTLLTPDGSTVFTSTAFAGDPNRADVDVVELAGGEYRVVVDARGQDLSTYRFSIQNAPIETRTIAVGEEVSDSIDTPGETDVYTFTASAGQRIFFDVREAASSAANLLLDFRLFAPGGSNVFNSTAFANQPNSADVDSVELAGGEYRLVVDARGQDLSTYRFIILNAPIERRTIAIGEEVSDTIDTPGETDEYTFTAAAGQRVFFDVREATGVFATLFLDFKLLAFDGSTVFTSAAFAGDPDRADVEPTVLFGGQYRLVVDARGQDLSTYRFSILNAPIETRAIAIGEEVSDSIDTPGETDEYTFTAAAGQRIFFDVREAASPTANLLLDFRLIAPNGTTVFNSTAFANLPNSADVDTLELAGGEYRLVVDAHGQALSTYRFIVLNAPIETRAITLGEEVTGAIESSGSTDEYTFTAAAGQRIFFDLREATGVFATLFLDFKLLAPDGSTVFTSTAFAGDPNRADVGPLELVAGNYRLVVDARGQDLSTYRFQFRLEGKVLVGSAAWTPSFLKSLRDSGLGDGGYDIRSRGRLHALPWSNINQVIFDFDEDLNVQREDLAISGDTSGLEVVDFRFDAVTFRATWTLNRPLRNIAPTFDVLGTPFSVRVFPLPGDSDLSGVVNASDLVLVRNRIGRTAGNPGAGSNPYTVFHDINGDGAINASDLVFVRNRVGTSLPITPPSVTSPRDGQSVEPARLRRDWLDLLDQSK